MNDLETIRVRYERERPEFAAVAGRVADELRAGMREAAIVCRIEHRAKEVHSLLLKAITKNKAYDEIRDKAAARVVLSYPDDRPRAGETIRRLFPRCNEDDRARPADHRQFDYSGWHFDVEAHGQPGVLCEVQLHTPGESMWANLAHDLVYKDDSAPYDQKRDAHRLRALTELFDLEAARIRDGLRKGYMAEERQVLSELLRHYLPLTAESGRCDVSLHVISSLLPRLLPAIRANFDSALSAFVDEQREKLRDLYQASEAARSAFMHQPESLLVFMMLESDPTSVPDAWPAAYTRRSVMDLAAAWGVQAHDPESLE